MSDRREREPEDELRRYWQGNTMGDRGAALARELSSRVTRFDRKIFWRNFREYAAGLVLIVGGGFYAIKGHKHFIPMILGAAFVMVYLWWQHRKLRPLDPTADSGVYLRALLERYDDQIRLLSRVRYWYLLPLYLPVLWMAWEMWPRYPWAAVLMLAIVTALYVFVGWLNEKSAVGKLKEARAEVQAMLKDVENT